MVWGKEKPRQVSLAGFISLQVGSVYVLRPGGDMIGIRVLVDPEALEYILRKEVIQPQVPLRLPCYDLVPIRSLRFGAGKGDFGGPSLSWLDGRCVQGSGTHSPQCC